MGDPLQDRLGTRWLQTFQPFGGPASVIIAAFDDLAERYTRPGRHYHTLDHIASVLDTVTRLGGTSPAVHLAAWYHDAVYDSREADNEERSADLARAALPTLGTPREVVEEAARLILLTKTHHAAPEDGGGQRLLDADLAILAADPATYDAYAAAIRREYARVPEADYRAGRRRVLEGFLARPRIYFVLTAAEAQARGGTCDERSMR